MGLFKSAHALWPPTGWNQFASIGSATGRAVAKDTGTARIFGLHYQIDSVPLFNGGTKFFRHDFKIEGWEYSIPNDSSEYPVLSFSLLDRFDLELPRECFVMDIRSYGSFVPHTRRSAMRTVGAALFLVRQINQDQVPDLDRVLRIYRLHPSQIFQYRSDRPQASRSYQAAASSIPRQEILR